MQLEVITIYAWQVSDAVAALSVKEEGGKRAARGAKANGGAGGGGGDGGGAGGGGGAGAEGLGGGAILVFLPGLREIQTLLDLLQVVSQ